MPTFLSRKADNIRRQNLRRMKQKRRASIRCGASSYGVDDAKRLMNEIIDRHGPPVQVGGPDVGIGIDVGRRLVAHVVAPTLERWMTLGLQGGKTRSTLELALAPMLRNAEVFGAVIVLDARREQQLPEREVIVHDHLREQSFDLATAADSLKKNHLLAEEGCKSNGSDRDVLGWVATRKWGDNTGCSEARVDRGQSGTRWIAEVLFKAPKRLPVRLNRPSRRAGIGEAGRVQPR